jgi:hypothetical protein
MHVKEIYVILKNKSLKLPVGVTPLQLVNLHRNWRYFVITLHTWFCLSYFLKTNIKLAAVSRNRYGVEKTVDTHKILINAITFYVCLQEI